MDLVTDENGSSTERAFLRMVLVEKTKSSANDHKWLLKRPATHFVIYKNEPYFYTDRPDPDPVMCQCLCSVLHSSEAAQIPLFGPHLESLRKMRQNRDLGRISKLSDLPQINLEEDISSLDEQLERLEKLPVIDRLTYNCTAKFKVN